MSRLPFFLPPSLGDRVLAAARSAKVTFCRFGNECEIEFELRGDLPAGRDADRLLLELAREFRRPLPSRDADGEEGGAV